MKVKQKSILYFVENSKKMQIIAREVCASFNYLGHCFSKSLKPLNLNFVTLSAKIRKKRIP